MLTARSPAEQDKLSVEVWRKVLTVASRFGFTEMLEKAIARLEDDPAVTGMLRLRYAKMLGSVTWYVRGICDLASRKAPLTLEESNRLGMETVVKVNAMRSKWHDLSANRPKSSRLRYEMIGLIIEDFMQERGSIPVPGYM